MLIGRQDNRPSAGYMLRRATLPDPSSGSSAHPLNKCLDSVRFQYTWSDVCVEFLSVHGNNQRMLFFLQKIAHIFPMSRSGREGAVICTIPMGWTMGQSPRPIVLHGVF